MSFRIQDARGLHSDGDGIQFFGTPINENRLNSHKGIVQDIQDEHDEVCGSIDTPIP